MCRSAVAVLVVMLLMSCGTTKNRSYQPSTVPDAESWVESIPLADGGSVRVATLEFDEFGFLWRANQLENAIAEVTKANKDERGAIVLTYVHGWHHSALTQNRTDFLDHIVKPLAHDEWLWSGAKPRPIVAIYIAWRGALYPGWRDFLPRSYYNRDAVANRIAPGAAANVLVSLISTAKANHSTRTVIIGHSLGGEIVEHAIVPALQTLLSTSAANGIEVDQWVRPVDLVTTINPAAPAIEARRFKDILQAANYKVGADSVDCTDGWHLKNFFCGKGPWLPLIVTLTSEGDWATSTIMHAAKVLATLREDYGVPGPADALRQVTSRKEAALSRFAPGFICEMLTHVLDVGPSSSEANDETHKDHSAHKPEHCSQEFDLTIAPSPLGWKQRHGAISCPANVIHHAGEPRGCIRVGGHEFRFLQIPEADDYWIVRVPQSVIPDHSRIFTPAAYHLLRGLMTVTGSIAPDRQWGAQVDAANSVAMSQAMGTRPPAPTGFSLPSACGLPPYVSFDFTGPTCSGNSSMERIPATCSAGEYTFDIRPTTIAEANCATVTWDFGDGQPANGMRVVRSLSTPGVVSVRVSYGGKWRDASIAMPVGSVITGQPPAAPLVRYSGSASKCSEANPRCRVAELVDFEVTNAVPTVVYLWNFGTQTAMNARAQYAFATGGLQRVSVTAQSTNGQKSTSSIELSTADCDEPPPPIRIALAADRRGCARGAEPGPDGCRAGDQVTFSVTPPPSCGEIEWIFPNGTTAKGVVVAHLLDATRPYHVSARLTTPRGTSSDSLTLPPMLSGGTIQRELCPEPQPMPRQARCTIDYLGNGKRQCRPGGVCRAGERVVFTASCGDGVPRATLWEFGDGTEESAASGMKTYERPGDYTVTAHIGGESPTAVVHVGRPSPGPARASSRYVVKRGDCLSTIAERFYGWQDWRRLWNLNLDVVGRNPDLIFPRQRLRIWVPE
jgi:hypothetical protein